MASLPVCYRSTASGPSDLPCHQLQRLGNLDRAHPAESIEMSTQPWYQICWMVWVVRADQMVIASITIGHQCSHIKCELDGCACLLGLPLHTQHRGKVVSVEWGLRNTL